MAALIHRQMFSDAIRGNPNILIRLDETIRGGNVVVIIYLRRESYCIEAWRGFLVACIDRVKID